MTPVQATRPAPFTYEQLDAYLGLCYSRRLVTNIVERQRDGSIRIKDASGTVLLSYEPHDYRFHVTYRLRGTVEARSALLCACGACTAA